MNKTPRSVGAPRGRGRPSANCAQGADTLLRSARRTFALRGFEAASVREIARQAGVDAALISHHFGSKEALWMAVVEQIARQVQSIFDTAADLRGDATLTPRQRVEQGLIHFSDRVFEDPDIGMFFSTAATEEGERLNALVDQLVRPFHNVFMPLLEDAMAAGEITPCDPHLLFTLLTQGISKTVAYSHVLRAVSPLPDDAVRFKRELLETVFRLLGPATRD
ncbi:TetR/AcrR family transcriptional regulator [Roseateles amylovorans]|uniref:TetR/AcrR family transcriptional regulator n=1 Tax=Roseateles amylovorans TaxID=2978473 RepID=A0ABY6B676_9BURK|nr:TetR/AcrR family transcriptional regulator [Roseateles amylovorans]UXH79446.1 TetR/AcrR family transcriptional regulator [Roseateles amylovorans]